MIDQSRVPTHYVSFLVFSGLDIVTLGPVSLQVPCCLTPPEPSSWVYTPANTALSSPPSSSTSKADLTQPMLLKEAERPWLRAETPTLLQLPVKGVPSPPLSLPLRWFSAMFYPQAQTMCKIDPNLPGSLLKTHTPAWPVS